MALGNHVIHVGPEKHSLLTTSYCYLAPHPLHVVWKRLLTFLRYGVGFWEALYKLEGEEEEEEERRKAFSE